MSELSRAGAAAAAPESDIFGWYRELDTKERRTLKASVGGWALDAMDAQLYAFVIPALISVWGITRGEAGQVQTAALLTSPAFSVAQMACRSPWPRARQRACRCRSPRWCATPSRGKPGRGARRVGLLRGPARGGAASRARRAGGPGRRMRA